MTDDYEKYFSDIDNKVKELYEGVKKINISSNELERNILKELIGVGPLLSSREEVIRLVSVVGQIVNDLEGAAYRIAYYEILRNAPKELINKMHNLAEKVVQTVNSLRECIYLLSYNPSGILEAAKKVVENEIDVDDIYRSISVESLSKNLQANELISINEIINRLDTATDATVDALRLITILMM